jgi:hypothetical protein
MLIRIPETDTLGEYPIVAATEELPAAPAALVAVQVFDEPDALGFQAYTGLLELTEFGNGELSGRFESTVREISTDILTHYVGVFERIALEPLTDEYCKAVADSAVADDSASTEG